MTNRFFAGQTDYIEQLNALDVETGDHIADTTGAHAATAISNTPAGNIAATTVQGAINELDTEKLSASAATLPSSFVNASLNSIVPYGGAALIVGDDATTRALILKGPGSGSAGGAAVFVQNGGATNLAIGNRSSIVGGAYSSNPMIYGVGSLTMNISGTDRVVLDPSYLRNQTGFADAYFGDGSALVGAAAGTTAVRSDNGDLLFSLAATEKARISSSGLSVTGNTTASGYVASGAQIYSNGANTAHGASRISMSQDAASTSLLQAYGANTSTNGTLRLVSRRSDGSNAYNYDFSDTGAFIGGPLSVFGSISGSAQIFTTGANTAHGASRAMLSQETSGLSMLTAYGPDAANNGALRIVSRRSDGSNSFTYEFSDAGAVLGANTSVFGSISATSLVDISAAGAGQIKFPATQNASADANTLDDYQEATYTGTATGMTTSPTGTVSYTLTGNEATLNLPEITGTSNATTFTVTGMPAEARPASRKTVLGRAQDNGGAIVPVRIDIETTGVLTIYANADAGAFTSSGTKTLAECSVTYTRV